MGRAQEAGVGLSRPVDIVGEVAAAGEEAEILHALNAGANSGLAHDTDPPMAWAPARMALTMLW